MKKILLLFCFFFALGTAVQAQTSSKVDVRNTEGSTETIYSDISFGNVSDVDVAAPARGGTSLKAGQQLLAEIAALEELQATYAPADAHYAQLGRMIDAKTKIYAINFGG